MKDFPKKIVLVASGSSPDRAIALEKLLASAAARSGWSERLDIRVGGIESGAGHASDAGIAALKVVGIDARGAQCADLDRRRDLVEGVAIVVCDRGDVADTIIDWDEASEAEFVVMDEMDGGPSDEEDDEEEEGRDVPIEDEVRGYDERIDEVLRRLVAGVLAD
jgi:hypothetical protein